MGKTGGQVRRTSARPASQSASPADPVLGEILRRARGYRGLSLRQVEQKIGVPNAHLSQIERGSIRRPDVAILMELAELYELDYRLVAEWAGYLDPLARRPSSRLAGMALRLFVDLGPAAQHAALEYLDQLRRQEPEPAVPNASEPIGRGAKA
jgi:HTH-type transcriptional regulator, competence development regulator